MKQEEKRFQVIETTGYETRSYNQFGDLQLTDNTGCLSTCHNLGVRSANTAYIKDGFLYTNFDEGTVFLSYLGNMEDEEGNLIVLDHELVNEYYVYSLKRRIIENLLLNGETIPQGVIQLIETRYKEAKVEGESLINMPDFADLEEASQLNRKQKYNKYYKAFEC